MLGDGSGEEEGGTLLRDLRLRMTTSYDGPKSPSPKGKRSASALDADSDSDLCSLLVDEERGTGAYRDSDHIISPLSSIASAAFSMPVIATAGFGAPLTLPMPQSEDSASDLEVAADFELPVASDLELTGVSNSSQDAFSAVLLTNLSAATIAPSAPLPLPLPKGPLTGPIRARVNLRHGVWAPKVRCRKRKSSRHRHHPHRADLYA